MNPDHAPMNKREETPDALFVRVLKVDPQLAARLVSEGFTTLEEIAYVPIGELLEIEGFEQTQIENWRNAARHFLLLQAIGNPDEGDPVSTIPPKSPKPVAGGSSAKLNRDEDC